MIIFVIAFWIMFSIGVGQFAESKGRSFWNVFWASVLLSPVLTLMFIALLPKDEKHLERRRVRSGTTRYCPHCAELIKNQASTCRYCGKDVPIEVIVSDIYALKVPPSLKNKPVKARSAVIRERSAWGDYSATARQLAFLAHENIPHSEGISVEDASALIESAIKRKQSKSRYAQLFIGLGTGMSCVLVFFYFLFPQKPSPLPVAIIAPLPPKQQVVAEALKLVPTPKSDPESESPRMDITDADMHGTESQDFAKDWIVIRGEKITGIRTVKPAPRGKIAILYSGGGKDVLIRDVPKGFLHLWSITPDALKAENSR